MESHHDIDRGGSGCHPGLVRRKSRLLFRLYPLLLVLSRVSGRLGRVLLVLLWSVFDDIRHCQLSMVYRFCRVLEDPRARSEYAMERQRCRDAQG